MKKKSKIVFFILGIIFTVILSLVIYVNVKYKHIDSEIRMMGFLINKFVEFDDIDSLKKLKDNRLSLPHIMSDEVVLDEVFIDTVNGKIKVFIMKSKDYNYTSNKQVGLLWLHGGGYALKSPKDELFAMERFVLENNSVVIAPEYTLSVDEPYPRAINDCYDTLLWMKENADKLGIRENQLFVGGTSAGGGLTASLTLMARDKGEVNIAFAMPLYPMINQYTISDDDKNFIWDKRRNKIAWELYLGKGYDPESVSKYAAALMEDDFSNLPPMYTFIGNQDSFYEDTLEYVNRLKKDNVVVNYEVYKGGFHAFEYTCTFCNMSVTAWDKLLDHYDYASKNYFAEQK